MYARREDTLKVVNYDTVMIILFRKKFPIFFNDVKKHRQPNNATTLNLFSNPEYPSVSSYRYLAIHEAVSFPSFQRSAQCLR